MIIIQHPSPGQQVADAIFFFEGWTKKFSTLFIRYNMWTIGFTDGPPTATTHRAWYVSYDTGSHDNARIVQEYFRKRGMKVEARPAGQWLFVYKSYEI